MRPATLAGIMILGVAPLVLVAGRTQSGSAYAVPIGEARKMLQRTGLPPFVFGSNNPQVTIRAEGPSRIVWVLHKDGAEMMRYVATLGADGADRTRIELDLVGATEGPYRATAERLARNGSIRRLYLVAMEEQIAATLEHRPFDRAAIMPATMAAAAANIGRINEDMDRIAEADQRRQRENIEKAYRDEAAGIRR